jgi:hypothetical protein
MFLVTKPKTKPNNKATVMFAARISIGVSMREGKCVGQARFAARGFTSKAGAIRR